MDRGGKDAGGEASFVNLIELNMKIIIANWKMNGNVGFVKLFIEKINQVSTNNRIIVCPPVSLVSFFGNFRYHVGAQNCFSRIAGAFTGENSPQLLKELGCSYVLLGHSERRAIFAESDDFVYEKWLAAVEQNLMPIVCVGENLQDRTRSSEILTRQLSRYQQKDLHNTIFAYEPVWSIGTAKIPSAQEISTTVAFMADMLAHSINYNIVYGGSVNAANAETILACPGVDGILVGGASLDIDEFRSVIENCNVELLETDQKIPSRTRNS
ncbi:MAG: triose-phosphate isomerase [Holosporaceae bacterium]|nr:triose-phosphate isomerase [Holosporaceae bacterium]